MCGIFFYLGNFDNVELIKDNFDKIKHRGPDNSIYKIINDKIFIGFHRLSINGLDESSNQPFQKDDIYLICNGEIFNFEVLKKEHHFEDDYKSNSDCEIILHLYQKYGIKKTCELLDGEFAFIIYDSLKNKIFVSRDQLGIRSLFMGAHNNEYVFSSELKSIDSHFETQQFEPRQYMILDIEKNTIEKNHYFGFYSDLSIFELNEEEDIIENIRLKLNDAVEKRLMSDRNIGCLLSGGLDSTIITGIVASHFKPYSINSYSIGMKGSVDVKFSKIASEYFKTNHHVIELNNEDFINAIEKTIYQIESYDVTTVRASIGNYLISCYIRDHSEDKVIFCGDVSDEIFGSYRGFYYAPDEKEFEKENLKMLKNIHYFDVLRSDKTISGASLEARVPFSDRSFIEYVMKIRGNKKMFDDKKMEKYLLRKAYEYLLPDELVWRVKTAFSDGVGCSENPWHETLKKYMESKYSDDEFKEKIKKYSHNIPYDKESLYYREIFDEYYPNKEKTIPYFWKQPFMDEEDPSAWCVEQKKVKLD